ncbi:hypothetical protein B5V01_30005 [Mesorhizobium erdmanii]|uniref:Uncharacterized protein n=2 Tax=Mesorhizobium TaxID=68287 RepID=A0A3M9X8H8_9HYPH|nr:hypothetical protein EB234_04165 [Mesorhizobium japonicum R7A]RNJ44303.1 hypothetical protein DNR46_16765 [Mesorhizobium japonicum]RXT36272.1 hypothetical protein B5V01_30005 [Mesorhizobium erdmanii]
MSGRTEGALSRWLLHPQPAFWLSVEKSKDGEAGVPSRPPLPCRASPPRGGRLAASTAAQ